MGETVTIEKFGDEVVLTEKQAAVVRDFAAYAHVPRSGTGDVIDDTIVVRDDGADDNDIEIINLETGGWAMLDKDDCIEQIDEGLNEQTFGLRFIDDCGGSKTIPLTAGFYVEENATGGLASTCGDNVVSMYDKDIVDDTTWLKEDEHERGDGFDASWWFEDVEIVEL